jgi:AsmA protein
MKLLKIAAWILAGIVGLVAIAIVWLFLWFDPNQYKPQIEKLVREKTGRTLILHGDLKLSLFPWLAVELGNTELGNAPGFGDQPMLSVERVRLGVKLRPLLQKRFEVGAVELEAPTLHLIKNAAGVSNWSDLGKSDDQQTPQPEAQSASFTASVASLHISKANISYDDEQAHSHTAVHDFSLRTGKLQLGEPVNLESVFTLEKSAADAKSKPLTAQVKLATQLLADFDTQRYDLSKFEMEMQITSGNGKPMTVKLQADNIHTDLAAQTAQVTALTATAADAKLTASLQATKIIDAPEFTGQLVVAPLSIRDIAKQLDIKLPVTRDTQVLKTFSMTAGLSGSSKAIQFKPLTMKLDDTTIKGSAGIADLEATALRFDLEMDRINVDRYLAPIVEPAKNAAPTDTGPTPIPAEMVRGLNAIGELRIAQATFSNVELAGVRVGMNAGNDKLRLNPLLATVYEGKFNGDVSIDASSKVPRVSLQEHITGVNFAPLFKALYKTQKITGRGDVNLQLAGSGADTAALKQTLNGKLDFNVDNGSYEGVDLWYEIRRARALLKQQAIPERSGVARTSFTALRASGVMTNGVLNNQDLTADMQYLKVTGKGTANLVNSTLDYRLETAVLKIPSEDKLAAQNQDIIGLTIPVTVTGALTDPKIRPDVTGMLKERARQELDKQKEKLEEKVKEKLQDKLKGLFGG